MHMHSWCLAATVAAAAAAAAAAVAGKRATGTRRGRGEASGKFGVSLCIRITYAVHKPLHRRLRQRPVAPPVSCATPVRRIESQHMLGLYTAHAVFSMHGWSLVLFAPVDGLGICSAYGRGNRPIWIQTFIQRDGILSTTLQHVLCICLLYANIMLLRPLLKLCQFLCLTVRFFCLL